MSERFYSNSPPIGGMASLEGSEAHHLTTVMRAKLGDQLTLFCGDGQEHRAEIVALSKNYVQLRIVETCTVNREASFAVEVACALPRGDRTEWLVEKLTEIGAVRLTPLVTQRSVVQPQEGKLEKLRQRVIEASKQCGRNVLMEISPPQNWAQYIRRGDLPADRRIAHVGAVSSGGMGSCVIAIGPEGGFSEAEVTAALELGWRPISLGATILRVETAAVVACVLAQRGAG